MKKIVLVAASLAVAGCSSTPAQLEEKAAPTVQAFPDNYQEIYRRVSGTTRRCIAGNLSAYASMAVDADLFPDLGHGQITVSLINMGLRNYFASAKIEKQAKGSQLTVKAGNTLAASNMVQNFLRWAGGDENC